MQNFLTSLWDILLDSGLWLLIGFGIAGILHVLLSPNTLLKYLQGNGWKPTLRGVLLGAPIPLCSCSVLPVAKALRDGGAGRGPTSGFLISAPETSVDTIALSWALLGPVWAIIRPVTAILSAMTAGILQPKDEVKKRFRQASLSITTINPCCEGDCCCASSESNMTKSAAKWRKVTRYGFLDMPTDLARYLLPGLALAALIGVFFPASSLTEYANGVPVYIAAVLLGLPMYICSTASTPLAASLLAAGVAPGPVLVFMLTGPATNIASFATVRQLLGTKGFVIQMSAIIGVAIGCGLLVDYWHSVSPFTLGVLNKNEHSDAASFVSIGGAIMLLILLVVGLYRDLVMKKR
ncbi:MAG: SO_0444 family Cu/Zn efflux transporter [bacterium]|nr:SO_0444 family Cu/Zn efflux transporter [bacterium]